MAKGEADGACASKLTDGTTAAFVDGASAVVGGDGRVRRVVECPWTCSLVRCARSPKNHRWQVPHHVNTLSSKVRLWGSLSAGGVQFQDGMLYHGALLVAGAPPTLAGLFRWALC